MLLTDQDRTTLLPGVAVLTKALRWLARELVWGVVPIGGWSCGRGCVVPCHLKEQYDGKVRTEEAVLPQRAVRRLWMVPRGGNSKGWVE